MRALPLMPAGVPIGALVLVRDITEVRRRDRALITKDATIREIHHRVKNNLQTVAALLRLQARRVGIPAARAALEESVRRVASIALVHETLSMSSDEAVEFDGIVDRVARAAGEVAADESKVAMRRDGHVRRAAGRDRHAARHGAQRAAAQRGRARVRAGLATARSSSRSHRDRRQLQVTVADDGRGLPDDFDLDSAGRLGLQIVRTLVTGELRGTIEIRPGAAAAPRRSWSFPLDKR